ncbi:DUF5133 domain-containing protein [Streptomyces vinaceus]|nr:DUF5133 domain-containing protein [Streptomyces vinaceus]GHE72438.1 hypothetical protein GCM10017778_67180 [Streptomyces vinaceus]
MSETPPRHATEERAVTVLMAVVPCGAETARRILADAARTAGAGRRETAEAVLVRESGGKPPAQLGKALAEALDEARCATEPLTHPYTRLLPDPRTIAGLLKRHRALRRRALAAPGDTAVRDELDDATYTLCILMGRRNAYAALRAAELLTGAEWLGTTTSGGPGRHRDGPPRLRGAGPRQQGATGRDFP